MKMLVFVMLFHVFLWEVNSEETENIVINRTLDKKDTFKIPASKCYFYDMERQCNSMGGKQLTHFRGREIIKVPCTCKCNFNNTNNVFGFFDNTWKCGSNRAVRESAEQTKGSLPRRTFIVKRSIASHVMKTLTFDGRSYDSPLLVIPRMFWLLIGKISMHNVTYHRCLLNEHFSFLDCNGTWKSMSHKSALDGFRSEQTGSPSKLVITIYQYGYRESFYRRKHIYGHVIKLEIFCLNVLTMIHHTYPVLLQVKGLQICPAVLPTMSSIKVTSILPQTSGPAPSSISSTNHTTTVMPFILTARYPGSGIHPNLLHKTMAQNKAEKAADTSGLIAGAIGGVAAFAGITIVVILIVVLKKAKRNRSTMTETSEGVENPGYSIYMDDNVSSGIFNPLSMETSTAHAEPM